MIEWVRSNYGCCAYADYYSAHIELWQDWWRGYYKPFHRYSVNNGKKHLHRDLYTLKMAKKVCEDWASILLNEKTEVKIGDDAVNRFVQGEKGTGGVLGDNHFWVEANRLVEKAFAMGTGAVTIRLENAGLRSDGTLTGTEDTRIRLEYISAGQIIPVSVRSGRITEAAFCSEHMEKGRHFTFLEVHTFEKGGYVIRNHLFDTENGDMKEVPLPAGLLPEVRTGSAVPWFAIAEPNIENNIPHNGGMGLSVFDCALDVLKGLDLAYNNLVQDIFLGQKKIFLKKDLVEDVMTADGENVAVTPNDVGQQLFTFVNFPMSTENSDKEFIYEFNPQLRIGDNTAAVQAQLDYLSFKCGLGNKHYQFNNSTVVTATQYTGDRQDLIQNAHKHYITVEEFVLSVIWAVIGIGRDFFGLNVPEDIEVEVEFDKSVIIDEDAEREKDRQDVRDSLMAPREYRMKWYGETEDEARAMIAEINGENVNLYGSDVE